MRLRLGDATWTKVMRSRYSGLRSKKRSSARKRSTSPFVQSTRSTPTPRNSTDDRPSPARTSARVLPGTSWGSGATLMGNGFTWVTRCPRVAGQGSPSTPPPLRDREVLPVHPALDGPLHRLEEVVAVVLGVEADEIGAQHSLQDLGLPRADAEGLEVRPRDVPEDLHPRVRPSLLHIQREQGKVIVLDQDQGRLHAIHLVDESEGELPVHRVVLLPVP